MTAKEQDMFYAQARSGYADIIRKRTGGKELFGTVEVADIFAKSPELIRAWIEEGRLAGVDMNEGRRDAEGNSIRASYTITRTAVLDLAERIEKGQ